MVLENVKWCFFKCFFYYWIQTISVLKWRQSCKHFRVEVFTSFDLPVLKIFRALKQFRWKENIFCGFFPHPPWFWLQILAWRCLYWRLFGRIHSLLSALQLSRTFFLVLYMKAIVWFTQKFALAMIYLMAKLVTFVFAGTEIEQAWLVLRNNWLGQEVWKFWYSVNVHGIKCPKRCGKMRRDVVQKFCSWFFPE